MRIASHAARVRFGAVALTTTAVLAVAVGPAPAVVDGPGLLASTYFGGNDSTSIAGDEVRTIARDAAGNIFIAGATLSIDLPTTAGAFDTTFANPDAPVRPIDAFVAKFDPTLTHLHFCTYLGGDAADRIYDLALDALGQPVVTGRTFSSDFPITGGDPPLAGVPHTFVTKLTSDGHALLWSRVHPARGGTAVSLDASGTVWIAGTSAAGLPGTTGSFDSSFNGGLFDAYVARLSSSGLLEWATYLGGPALEEPYDLVLAENGEPIVVGYTGSPSFPTTAGAFDPALDATGGFCTRLTADGTTLVWSTFVDGNAHDQVNGLVRTGDALYLAVMTDSDDFPTSPGAYDRSFGAFPGEGLFDAAVIQLRAQSGAFQRGTYLGGFLEEFAQAVAVLDDGRVALVGSTFSEEFPRLGPAPDPGPNDLGEGFLTCFDPTLSELRSSALIGGQYSDDPVAVVSDGHRLYVAGSTGSDDYPTTWNAFDTTWNSRAPGVADGTLTLVLPLAATEVSDPLTMPRLIARRIPGAIRFTLQARAAHGGSSRSIEQSTFATNPAAPPLEILDLQGRLVHRVHPDFGPSTALSYTWHRDDAHGNPVPSGLYWARSPAFPVESARVVLLR